MIKGFLLIFGILLPSGEVQQTKDISPVYFDSYNLCIETAKHSAVIGSYAQLVKPHELRLWCEPVRTGKSK